MLGRANLGMTVGEEALLDRTYEKRSEDAYADVQTCLLEITSQSWEEIKLNVYQSG